MGNYCINLIVEYLEIIINGLVLRICMIYDLYRLSMQPCVRMLMHVLVITVDCDSITTNVCVCYIQHLCLHSDTYSW